MTFRKTFAASVIVLVMLQACNKKEVVKNGSETSDSTLKKDSIVVSPMAHIMDSATTSGQTFSALKNGRITLKEDAITLKSLTELSTENAYVIFNEDQSKAELFLPNGKNGILMERKETDGNYNWTDGNYILIKSKGYILRTLKDEKPLFGSDVI